jgi:hypothetical protein
LVRLSQIASVGTLLSQLFIHVGDTSCWAVRLTLLSGAGSVTRPVRADGSPCHIRARKSGSQRSRAVKRDASRLITRGRLRWSASTPSVTAR